MKIGDDGSVARIIAGELGGITGPAIRSRKSICGIFVSRWGAKWN